MRAPAEPAPRLWGTLPFRWRCTYARFSGSASVRGAGLSPEGLAPYPSTGRLLLFHDMHLSAVAIGGMLRLARSSSLCGLTAGLPQPSHGPRNVRGLASGKKRGLKTSPRILAGRGNTQRSEHYTRQVSFRLSATLASFRCKPTFRPSP